jgi:hypothetical protein
MFATWASLINAIQAAYWKKAPKTAERILSAVQEAVDEYDEEKVNRLWLTLQSCMNEIIDSNGNNDYKIPHLNKARMEREGTFPEALEVTDHDGKVLMEAFGEY